MKIEFEKEKKTVYYITIEKSTNTITTRIQTVDFYGKAGSVEFDTLTATIVGTDSQE